MDFLVTVLMAVMVINARSFPCLLHGPAFRCGTGGCGLLVVGGAGPGQGGRYADGNGDGQVRRQGRLRDHARQERHRDVQGEHGGLPARKGHLHWCLWRRQQVQRGTRLHHGDAPAREAGWACRAISRGFRVVRRRCVRPRGPVSAGGSGPTAPGPAAIGSAAAGARGRRCRGRRTLPCRAVRPRTACR